MIEIQKVNVNTGHQTQSKIKQKKYNFSKDTFGKL